MGGARGSGDGRVLRGRRNRDAVVEAFLSLIQEGATRPTAKEIAARAGLSRRSVFQHFADTEAIYEAAGRRQLHTMAALLEPPDPSGCLEDRIAELVDRRVAALDLLDPVARAARLREPFSVQLQANRAMVVELMRGQIRAAFAPELATLAAEDPAGAEQLLTALAASASWSAWYHLCHDQALERSAAQGILTVTLSALLHSVRFRFPEVRLAR